MQGQELADFAYGGILLQAENSFIDEGDSLESSGILEQCYTMIANGIPVDELATALGIPTPRLDNILKSSAGRMAKFFLAESACLAGSSVKVLKRFKDVDFLVPEENSAVKHHANMLQAAANLAAKGDGQDKGVSITVNTENNYGVGMDIPAMPDNIKRINSNG